MAARVGDIFQSRFADLSNAMTEPGPIADSFWQEGLIARASRDRAAMITIIPFERASQLLAAVHAAIKNDFKKPELFNKACSVLKKFSETAAYADAMQRQYYGTQTPPPPPPAAVPAARPSAQSVSFTVGEDQDYFKALKLGKVKTRITKAVVQGEARSGKTSLKCLLLRIPYNKLSTSAIEAPKLAISESQSSEAYGRVSTNQFGRSYGKSWKLVNDEDMYSIVLAKLQSIKNSKSEENPAARQHNHLQQQSHGPDESQIVSLQSGSSPLLQIELEEAIAKVNELLNECREIEGEENLEFNQEWLYFIDSGGQIQFQKLVPVFIPFASVLLLVVNLSNSLKGEASTAMQLENGQQIRVSEHSLTVEEVLKQLLSAIASSTEQYKSTLPAGITPPPGKLNVIAVATHRKEYDELVKEKKEVQPLEEIEVMLNKIYIPNKQKCQLIRRPTRKILHEVDGSKAIREEYNDLVVKQIADMLASQAFEVDVPIAWYCFGVLLHKIAKDGCGVLSLSYCQALGMRLQIPEDEVASALKFLHILNMLLYYPDSQAVADMVFVEVHSLIDIVRELVILVCNTRKNWEAEKDIVVNLATKGYLSVKVLKELKECTFHKIEQEFDEFGTKLLGLFEDLLIAARVRLPEEDIFFAPSLLPVKDVSDVDLYPEAGVSPLLFFFKDAVPMGLFCAFIVYLLSVQVSEDDDTPATHSNPWRIIRTNDLNWSNHCTLQNTSKTEMKGNFDFVEKPDCIELHVSAKHLANAQVADAIEKAIIDTIEKRGLLEIKAQKAFYCDCQVGKLKQPVGIVDHEKMELECPKCDGTHELDSERQRCWFPETDGQSPVGSGAGLRERRKRENSQQSEQSELPHPKQKKLSMTYWIYVIVILIGCSCVAGGFIIYNLLPQGHHTQNNQPSGHSSYSSHSSHVEEATKMYKDELRITQLEDVKRALKDNYFDNTKWKDVGLSLGLYLQTLNDFERDSKGVKECLLKTLEAWLERQDDVDKRGGATWSSLTKALHDNGSKAVAEGIEKYLANG